MIMTFSKHNTVLFSSFKIIYIFTVYVMHKRSFGSVHGLLNSLPMGASDKIRGLSSFFITFSHLSDDIITTFKFYFGLKG